jgi:CHASE3 domain sensor protein
MGSQMTIGKKLFSCFAASLALTLVVGGTSLWLISSLGASLKRTANVIARKQLLAAEIDTRESDMLAAERGILLRGMMKDSALVAQYNQDFTVAAEKMKGSLEQMRPLIETEEGHRILSAIPTWHFVSIMNSFNS